MNEIAARFAGRIGGFALDVAFEVPAAGVTGLFGPSGSGKTTLLRCLAGLERVVGSLRVGGDTWQDERRFVATERRRVGYVFQGMNLLPHLSVRGNLAYAARRAPDGPFAFDDVVARTGIATLLDRAPAKLSGGESQRVAIARALLAQPRLLLMDEPLAGLDTGAKAELLGALAALLPAIGLPTFYVSHDPSEIARLATRRILLAAGRVVLPSEKGVVSAALARIVQPT